MTIDLLEWIWVLVSGAGVVINWIVLHKTMVDLHGLQLLGINGSTQRDARWMMWQDGTLTAMQVIVCLCGLWRLSVPAVIYDPSVATEMAVPMWLVIVLSALMSSMGIRNILLRRLQFQDVERNGGRFLNGSGR